MKEVTLDLFSQQPAEKQWPLDGWHCFPSGRWCRTMEAHGGMIALHAFIEGDWAVTRGNSLLSKADTFLVGSREDGQPKGSDVEQAMQLAEDAANVIVERERKAVQGQ